MRWGHLTLSIGVLTLAGRANAGTVTTFDAGTMIIPMDATYQDEGILDAYGLVYALLREGIQVSWVVDSSKVYGGDDLVDVSTYLTSETSSDATVRSFSGGPFVVAAADVVRAEPILDAWQAAGWSAVAYFTTDAADMEVSRTMFVAPSIAIFEDGNEEIAWDYLNAAGIPDFDGNTWDSASVYNLSEEDVEGPDPTIAGDGALFDDEGYPAYCHLNAMHWDDGSAGNVVMEVHAFAEDQLTSSLFECVAGESMENDASYGSMISSGIAEVGLDRGHATWTVDNPEAELLQMVGDWGETGGSLPDFTGTYVSGVVTLTGVDTHGRTSQVVASARLDGDPSKGKVSFLAGHEYDVRLPYSTEEELNGVRVFLNSYFTADCDNLALAPDVAITGTPAATDLDVTLALDVSNSGVGRARHTTFTLTVPAGLTYVSDDAGGVCDATTNTVTWDLATLDSGEAEAINLVFTAAADGTYTFSAEADYYVEATGFEATWTGSVDVYLDTDDDGLSDTDEGTLGTDPLDADTDDDGLDDGTEVNDTLTDPLDADSDDGGVEDGDEVDRGTDPLDASDDFPSSGGDDTGGGGDSGGGGGDSGGGGGDSGGGGGDSGGAVGTGVDTGPGDSGGNVDTGVDTGPGDSGGNVDTGVDTGPADSGGRTDTAPDDTGAGPDDDTGGAGDTANADDTAVGGEGGKTGECGCNAPGGGSGPGTAAMVLGLALAARRRTQGSGR